MVTVEAIRGYLVARGVTAPVVDGFEEAAMPDEMIFATALGGAGDARERLFERPGVQIRVRGRQNDHASAEALAGQVDEAFMAVTYPVTIAGRHVASIQRLGGLPALVARDDARRSVLSASYIFDIATAAP